MTVRLVDLPPQALKPREKLFEFLRGHDRILCELVDHGSVYGVEAQFFYNEELAFSRTFPPYLSGSRTSREMAIFWAEAERKAITGRQKRDA
jgi:hypothetical protein